MNARRFSLFAFVMQLGMILGVWLENPALMVPPPLSTTNTLDGVSTGILLSGVFGDLLLVATIRPPEINCSKSVPNIFGNKVSKKYF